MNRSIWRLFIMLSMAGCVDVGSEAPSDAKRPEIKWKNRLNNHTEWGIYRGHATGIQYSELDQINASNVSKLQKAWEYHHGNPAGPGMYANPIIVDGLLYFTTPEVNAVALNAATGEEVWVFKQAEHNTNAKESFRGRNRGLVFWEDAEGNNKRIFNFVRDRVYAIDAKTGELITSFGENGFIDLKKNLPLPPELVDIETTTQGIVYKTSSLLVHARRKKVRQRPGMFAHSMR